MRLHARNLARWAVVAVVSLLVNASSAAAGDPWWVVRDAGIGRFAIEVNAGELARNEYVDRADCAVLFVDAAGSQVGRKVYRMGPPSIRAGAKRVERFDVDVAGAVAVRGENMNWVVEVLGGKSDVPAPTRARSGASPPRRD